MSARDQSQLPFTPLAQSLPASVPFVGPEAQARSRGQPFAARLGANESPFGPSPQAVEAMARAAADVWMYGDPENHDLREALAAHHGVPANRIAIGEGIDGLLQNLVRLLVGPGTPVVTSAGAYPTFGYHVAGFGGALTSVPYRDDHEDPESLLAATERTGASLCYLANPDNPMGTFHRAPVVAQMLADLPGGAVLALDEAYAEFVDPAALLPMSFAHPRLVRLRTFSKAYGMAGARIAYAVTTPQIAKAFDKVRNHFGVNRIAQAGALAALADHTYLRAVVEKVERARARIGEIANQHGLNALPSSTNFVALETEGDGAFAKALVGELAARGVFVRMPFVAPQNRCIRVSAAPDAMLDGFAAALGPALDAVRRAPPIAAQ